MSVKLKVHTHQLTAALHKALGRPMRALANKVVKNKVQRKILNNEIASVVVNAANAALVTERSNFLKNINGGSPCGFGRRYSGEESTLEVSLRSLVQRFSEAEFSMGESESKEEFDAVVTAFNDELKIIKAEDKAGVMDIIDDVSRGGVWVGQVSGNFDMRYGIEVLSPNNDLAEDKGKFGTVVASELHKFIHDREAFFEENEKKPRSVRRAPNCQFYYSDELKDFVTADQVADMKDSKEVLRGYNRNYDQDGYNY